VAVGESWHAPAASMVRRSAILARGEPGAGLRAKDISLLPQRRVTTPAKAG
jgi:hypothetical protein